MAQSINIKIAGRAYNLHVTSPEQEEVIRMAAEDINKKIAHYQEKFPTKGITEIMSFMALNVCMNNIILQKKVKDTKDEVDGLAEMLGSYLESNDKASR